MKQVRENSWTENGKWEWKKNEVRRIDRKKKKERKDIKWRDMIEEKREENESKKEK
jgi:hypothetical protein